MKRAALAAVSARVAVLAERSMQGDGLAAPEKVIEVQKYGRYS
ncbi:hypothetical protein OG895_23705 [Streptomyces sp. NBC_00201]|nr:MULTISPECIES: hypothetical protein [unclassified Streptomyces]MCX5248177.1 hypothetical protein [Streptomyces sp. NBC_00201]MCX5293764.1 hypothetical protein [Streptomyces sp. NBC_00183]